MAATILFTKPETQELANIYQAYALQNAELVAKKELALIGMAINNAAAKGATSVNYKASKDFTTLQGAYYNKAVEIMDADFQSAGYTAETTVDRNGYAIAFSFDWSVIDGNTPSGGNSDPAAPAEEDWEEIPDPVVEPTNPEEPAGDNENT